jgi:HAD superfamily hydrolase (TIGR01490 family)
MASTGTRRAAFFDLERTITREAAEQEGALEFFRRGEAPLSAVVRVALIYLRYDLGLIADFDAMKRSGARVFEGRDHARDVRLLEDHFERHMKHAIHPEAVARIEEFKRENVPDHIVSSTYLFIVAPYARYLGVDSYYGTQLEVIDGRTTGRIVDRIYHQRHKAQLVEEIAQRDGVELEESYAFGDSVNDREMLEKVGHPVR